LCSETAKKRLSAAGSTEAWSFGRRTGRISEPNVKCPSAYAIINQLMPMHRGRPISAFYQRPNWNRTCIEMVGPLSPTPCNHGYHFRVGARPEDVSSLFEFRAQLLEVINLAVQDYQTSPPHRTSAVRRRGHIESRRKPKPTPAVKIVSLVVRSAMDHGLGHRRTVSGFAARADKLTGRKCAHIH